MSTHVPRPWYDEVSRGTALPAGTASRSVARMTTALTTWLPDGFLFDPAPTATFVVMKQYLTVIENLVREGKTEAQIEAAVKRLVEDDVEALDAALDEELRPAA